MESGSSQQRTLGRLISRLRGAPLALVLRFAGRAAVFVLAIVLARELGVEGFGVYSYATAWVAVLLVISNLGHPGLILRQTAIYESQDRPDLILDLVRRSRRLMIGMAFGLTVLAAIGGVIFLDPIFVAPLLIALPAVVVRTSSSAFEGVLQGLGRTELAFLPTFVIYPFLMLLSVGGLLVFSVPITPELTAFVYLISFSVGAVVVWRLVNRRLRQEIDNRDEWQRDTAPGHLSLLIPFTALALLTAAGANIGLIALGLLDLPDAVGTLQAALKLTEPMMLIYTVINITLAARIARLFHLGERIALQGAVTRAVRSSFLLALPVGLAILLAREPLLDLFGPGFEESSALLLILVPAVLFNIFTGASGAALMMTDHPRPALAARAVGFVVNVTLCVILIPESGATGAAVAMAADILVANSIMAVMAAKYLRLNTTMVPSFLFGRGS